MMRKRIPDHLISALIGGIVGAVVVLFATGQLSTSVSVHAQNELGIIPNPPNGKFMKLEVENLVVTKQATVLGTEGKEDVVIREGSVLAMDTVLGKKFVGTQYQGHVFVANRMFTSPDDLVATPQDKWRFFTETGSTVEAGGEMIVRSANGPNIVGQEVRTGSLLRAGFDEAHTPQLFARNIESNLTLPVPFLRAKPNGAIEFADP